MADLKLIIGNKNYSSWSLRPWLLMRQFDIPFEEELLPLFTPEFHEAIGDLSPNKCVPVLHHGDRVIWDTLAIAEYLAEQFPEKHLWPESSKARAFARSCVAEMHSGFFGMRNELPMNIRGNHESFSYSDAAAGDIARILDIWQTCRNEFSTGEDLLFGAFCIADAFYAPVVWRFRTYGVKVPGALSGYMDTMAGLPAMQEWKTAAEAERWTIDLDEV